MNNCLKYDCFYSFVFILLVHLLPSYWCFFIRHHSGWCVRTSPSPFLSNDRIQAWYLVLTDDCNNPNSQFRFISSGVIQHIATSGCVLPINGKLAPADGTNLVVLYGQKECLNETRHGYKQTMYNSWQHHSGKCVQPHTAFQSVPSVDARLEYTYVCNTTKQQFVFGSVTCDDSQVFNTNCPNGQVMVISIANYGGYGHLQTCGYSRNYNCKLKSSLCEMKGNCEGLSSCDIKVDSKGFQTDPCPEIKKYLYLEYNCLNKTSFKESLVKISNIRLGFQATQGQGYVDVMDKSNPTTWQRTCVRNWGETEKQVICRHLGYSGYAKRVTLQPITTALAGHMTHLDIYCNDDNDDVTSCCFQRVSAVQSTCAQQTQLSCSICSEPILTRENRTVNDVIITASNSIPWYTADQAVMTSNRSWCGVRTGDYLKVDLSQQYIITQLSTSGDLSRGQFVTSFLLYYAKEDRKWTQAKLEDETVFTSHATNDAKLSSNIFNNPISARFLKIIPKTWKGQPCLRIELCGHKLLPDAPVNVTLVRLSSHDAVLSWFKPRDNGHAVFTNYSIQVLKSGKLEQHYTTIYLQYTLVHLKPYINYTVTIRAGNVYGYGLKAVVTFRTHSAVPSGAPTNIIVTSPSAVCLLVKWQPPLLRHRNGLIESYEICSSHILSTDDCERVVKTRRRVLRICELESASKYRIKILAKNDAGFGNYSSDYFHYTNSEAPLCNYTSVTTTTFTVQLQRPIKEVRICQVVVMPLSQSNEKFFDGQVTYLESPELLHSSYIAAEFLASDFYKYNIFTIGDGSILSALKHRNNNKIVQKYNNEPLSPNNRYTVVQKFYTDEELLYKSDEMLPITTIPGNLSYEKQKGLNDSDKSRDRFKIPFMVVIVIFVVALLLLLGYVIVVRYRKQKLTKEQETEQADEEIPMNTRKNNNLDD